MQNREQLIRGAIFDRDGVLTDFDYARLHHFFGPRVPLSLAEIAAAWAAHGGVVGFPRTHADEVEFFRGFWRELCHELQLPAAILADLEAFDYTTCLRPFPDARPALVQARAAGYKVGVLSNFALATLDVALAAAGLADLVDAACAAPVIGASKPDPAAYILAAGALGLRPEECLFFDDEQMCIEGARQVGMQAYRVDRSRQTHAWADGVIADLGAVATLVQSLG